jgi:hypothetical protein
MARYQFEFRKGPIFTQLLLTDEINRATPKTQSALLETMQGGSATAAGTTHTLIQPFFVLATQNPLEQEGAFPLPEAQLDRFMFKLNVPFLNRAELNEVVRRTTLGGGQEVAKIMDGPRILELRGILEKIVVTMQAAKMQVKSDRPLWWPLAAAGLAVLLLEWWRFQRCPDSGAASDVTRSSLLVKANRRRAALAWCAARGRASRGARGGRGVA